MIEIEAKSRLGIGSGNSPQTKETALQNIEGRKIEARNKKARMLRAIQKAIQTSIKEGTNKFPDIAAICLDNNINVSTFRLWKKDDPEFKAKYDKIEEFYIERCKARVFDSSLEKGGGWLALEILRQKDEEWKQKANNQFYTQINLVTNLRSDNDILGNAVEMGNNPDEPNK